VLKIYLLYEIIQETPSLSTFLSDKKVLSTPPLKRGRGGKVKTTT